MKRPPLFLVLLTLALALLPQLYAAGRRSRRKAGHLPLSGGGDRCHRYPGL